MCLLNYCLIDYFHYFLLFKASELFTEIFHLFIYERLPRIASSALMSCYQWWSCLQRSLMELAMISNFHHRRPYRRGRTRDLLLLYTSYYYILPYWVVSHRSRKNTFWKKNVKFFIGSKKKKYRPQDMVRSQFGLISALYIIPPVHKRRSKGITYII